MEKLSSILSVLQRHPSVHTYPDDSSQVSAPVAVDPFPYGDPIKFQCLLCQRQFKGIEELKRHSEQSDLHKVSILLLPSTFS